jgi:hypothetical protein
MYDIGLMQVILTNIIFQDIEKDEKVRGNMLNKLWVLIL